MRKYIKIIDDIQNLLIGNFRKRDIPNEREKFKGLVLELKQDYQTEISTQFLFNLMNNSEIEHRKKLQRISNLTRETDKERTLKVFRGLENMKYETLIIDYKYNKNGKVCKIPLRLQRVCKEFIATKSRMFNIIKR